MIHCVSPYTDTTYYTILSLSFSPFPFSLSTCNITTSVESIVLCGKLLCLSELLFVLCCGVYMCACLWMDVRFLCVSFSLCSAWIVSHIYTRRLRVGDRGNRGVVGEGWSLSSPFPILPPRDKDSEGKGKEALIS
jgi:hypothetical protein